MTAVLTFRLAFSVLGEETLWCRSLGVEDGLPQNFVTAIAQDRNGFMWFGTAGGLSQWDGYDFKRFVPFFNDTNSLSDSVILALHAVMDGKLWVGTRRGIDCFDPGRNAFQRYGQLIPAKDDLGPVSVEAITSDRSGRVWFASFGGPQLCVIEPGSGQVSQRIIAGSSRHRVTALHADSADRLWVAMEAGKDEATPADRFLVYAFDRVSEIGAGPLPVPTRPFDLDEAGGRVMAMREDETQRLWFGRDGGGLMRFDPASGAVARVDANPQNPDAMPDGVVRALNLGPRGSMWVLTRSPSSEVSATPDRLYRVDCDTLAARRVALRNSTVRAVDDARLERMAIDTSGILWLGSNGGGLRYADISAGGFSLFAKATASSPGLDSSFVRAICLGRDGTLGRHSSQTEPD